MYYLGQSGYYGAAMSKMTAKGQVTIPKPLRDYLGVKPGSEVTFEIAQDGRIYLKAHGATPKSRFAALRGSLKTSMTTDQIMALLRGDGDK